MPMPSSRSEKANGENLGNSIRIPVWRFFRNGVDYRRFASADGAAFRKKYRLGNGPLILCVGSFHRQKNQMTLFEAFAGLRKTSMSDVKLILIGVVYDEAYFREISARAADSGLADSTLLLPNLPYDSPDLANAYAAADLFVLPSLYEPFGIVVLEAWSAKCPVDGRLVPADLPISDMTATISGLRTLPTPVHLQKQSRNFT